MKILILMDPAIPVPPKYYGGIERVVYDVACEYVDMGHEVTLIAGPNSLSPGRLITFGNNSSTQSIQIDLRQLLSISRILYREIPKHDVIHNFGRLLYLFPIAWFQIKKIHTYMRYITPSNVRYLNLIGARNLEYTSVSKAILNTGISGGGKWNVVYNCAPVNNFNFTENVNSDAPLVFLGRFERCKGAHTAIQVAIKTGRQLILAGNISPLSEEIEYFEKEIKPFLSNPLVKYIGEVDNSTKSKILGSAAAMLLPVEWFEPFPIVIPESYACGTPILAFPGGGVPEGIEHGKTGFICKDINEMINYVFQIHELSRQACRQKAENEYSRRAIATDYLRIYQQ